MMESKPLRATDTKFGTKTEADSESASLHPEVRGRRVVRGVQPRGRTGRARAGLAMAAREAAEAMGRGLRQSVSASGGHVPVKAARVLHDRPMIPGERPSDCVDEMHALARLIEVEELRYERLVGDSGGSHRAGYAIGRILSLVQDDVSGVDVVSKYCLDALTSRSDAPRAQAAALRLLCSVVSVTGQFPLTDERLVERLRAWALGDLRPRADAALPDARARSRGRRRNRGSAPPPRWRRRASPPRIWRGPGAARAALEALRVKTYAAQVPRGGVRG